MSDPLDSACKEVRAVNPEEMTMTTRLRDKMADDLALRCYRKSTCTQYLEYARRFAEHFGVSPLKLSEKDVRTYLLYLKKKRKVGPATLKGNIAALKFFYVHTLKKPEVVASIPWPKVPVPLPDILSGTEVLCLLENIHSFKYRAIIMTAYGTGMRVGEACSLKPGDIDSQRMLIHIRDGKRGRDRYVMLPEKLLLCLREYWRAEKPKGDWLFPGRDSDSHIGADAVRDAVRKATLDAGITKHVTPHVMRHTFATHLLESGTDIRIIQALLGHGSIRTTERYAKVSRSHVGRTKSPLDLLGTKKGKKKLG